MSQTEASYLKAWVGTVLAVILLLGITWLSSAILATRPADENQGTALPPISESGTTEVPPEESSSAATRTITVEGSFSCLPHKNTSGPQTMECAISLAADDGKNYSLDLMAVTYPGEATRVRITGAFTPAEALSSDVWQKYDMVGIIRVESVEPL